MDYVLSFPAMNSGNNKVIRSFGERLTLDQAVRALADAPNAYELDRRARDLAQHGDAILNPMLRQLDTENPKLRGGLGLLAQYLDPELVVPALHQVAADPRRPDNVRLTAVMILERYLDILLEPSLAQFLPEPDDVAQSSAEQALELAESEPLILVEYAEQLLEETPEVVNAVLDVIMEMEDPLRASLLTAIASYAGTTTIARILPTLGSIRHPAAFKALLTLQHISEPELRPAIERQMRKLRLAGVRLEPATSLRALWSPVNAQGQSLLWFIRYDASTGQAYLLIFVLHDTLGAIHAEARAGLDADSLPMPAPLGTIHRLQVPNSDHLVRLAEIDPRLGLALMDEAIELLRVSEIPWPGELVVYGHWLWGQGLAASGPEAWPAPQAPAPEGSAQDFQNVLKHAAFASWAWDIPDMKKLMKHFDLANALQQNHPIHREICRRLVSGDTGRLLAQRLGQQARWLALVGDTDTLALVRQAQAAVQAQQSDHPFVQAVAWRSMLTAAADEATAKILRLRPEDDAAEETPDI